MNTGISYIYLFTDFGWQGAYLAQMETAVLQLAPDARVLNLQSDAPCANPRAAAYLLGALSEDLPDGSLVVAVVDPGVGGERRALLVESAGRYYIGPDNGLLSRVVGIDDRSRVASIVYDPADLSDSFHGRDLFAPVGARLSLGLAVPTVPLARQEIVGADWAAELAEVIYRDRFGNLFTGIRATSLGNGDHLLVAGKLLGYARTFCEAQEGALFWYRNSCGLVEIAANRGSAADLLHSDIGSGLSVVN